MVYNALPAKVSTSGSSAASKIDNVGSPLTFARPGRHRAAMAAVCVALVLVAVGIQVLHHCSALELAGSNQSGTEQVN